MQPKSLTREEQGELLDFTGFVFRAFRQSKHVPSDFESKLLIVSAGYVGISMHGADFQTAKWSGCYYGACRDQSLETTWDLYMKWLHELHVLGGTVK